jgi:hypothetical protein
LEDFWKMCIEEGDVSRVGCPDPECVKNGSEAREEEVARVVTETELQRWRWLKEKRNIERGGYGSGLAVVGLTEFPHRPDRRSLPRRGMSSSGF